MISAEGSQEDIYVIKVDVAVNDTELVNVLEGLEHLYDAGRDKSLT